MDEGFLVDWSFSCKDSIQQQVESQFPQELHRWPILKGFNAEGYNWKENYCIIILRDKIQNIPNIGKIEPLNNSDAPTMKPTLENLEGWLEYIQKLFLLRPQDFVIILPFKEGQNVTARWEKMNEEDKQLWRKQVSLNVTRHFYYLKGFDIMGDFFLPPGYLHLTEECQQFLKDNPNFEKNVFIMMKFDKDNSQLKEIETELRSLLKEKGFNPLRADDKVYPKDRDLWNNVCTYMICCKQGIAVLENKSKDEYNPNVAIEYGFMRALNKRALLLAEKNFPLARADVVGKLREKFDIDDIKTSICNPIEKWIKEIESS